MRRWLLLACLGLTAAVPMTQLRETVTRDVPLVRACYELFLMENPALAGRFTLQIQLNEQGGVDHAIIEESSLRHTELEGCVLAIARKWTFAAAETAVTVQLPFHFKPVSMPTTAPGAMTAMPLSTVTAPPTVHRPAPVDAAYPSPYFVLFLLIAMFVAIILIVRAIR